MPIWTIFGAGLMGIDGDSFSLFIATMDRRLLKQVSFFNA
jgi:hypothetical protein